MPKLHSSIKDSFGVDIGPLTVSLKSKNNSLKVSFKRLGSDSLVIVGGYDKEGNISTVSTALKIPIQEKLKRQIGKSDKISTIFDLRSIEFLAVFDSKNIQNRENGPKKEVFKKLKGDLSDEIKAFISQKDKPRLRENALQALKAACDMKLVRKQYILNQSRNAFEEIGFEEPLDDQSIISSSKISGSTDTLSKFSPLTVHLTVHHPINLKAFGEQLISSSNPDSKNPFSEDTLHEVSAAPPKPSRTFQDNLASIEADVAKTAQYADSEPATAHLVSNGLSESNKVAIQQIIAKRMVSLNAAGSFLRKITLFKQSDGAQKQQAFQAIEHAMEMEDAPKEIAKLLDQNDTLFKTRRSQWSKLLPQCVGSRLPMTGSEKAAKAIGSILSQYDFPPDSPLACLLRKKR